MNCGIFKSRSLTAMVGAVVLAAYVGLAVADAGRAVADAGRAVADAGRAVADAEKPSPLPTGKKLATIYDDQRGSGWTSMSTANVSLVCASPVHSGAASIRVDIAARSHGTVEFASDPFDASRYGVLSFWIDGGSTGGQQGLVVRALADGVAGKAVPLPALEADTWMQVVVPFDALGVADEPKLTGFRIESAGDAAVPTFYIDDIGLYAPANAVPLHVPVPFKPTGQALEFTGVNISGGEFAHPHPGQPNVYGKNYIYPTNAELDYFAARGVNVIRLPFRWEVLQPALDQPILPQELDRLKAVATAATARGMRVMIDPHDFQDYFGKKIGSAEVPDAAFASFWSQLAAAFKDNPLVWFALMNEPNGTSIEQWFDAAQAAVTAIRQTGATNLILVPGEGYTGAHSWLATGSDKMLQIVDPANNFQFEAHQYLDGDNSGTSPDAVSATIGSERLKSFTEWCRKVHKRAFLGEFGVSSGKINHAALDDMLAYMEANRDVWMGFTWWSSGAWWGDYMYTVEPTKDGQDRAQLLYLQPHLHGNP